MRKNVLLLASVVFVMMMPNVLAAEVINDWKNITVKGGKKDKKVERLNPGTYNFTLKISGKGKNVKPKFIINQKNAVVGVKKLHGSKYGKGTHTGKFIVQARRLTSASGSAAGGVDVSPAGVITGGNAEAAYEGTMENVDATRQITFKVKNPVGKKKIKYSLKITKQ